MIKNYNQLLLYNTDLIQRVTETNIYSNLKKTLCAYNGSLWYALTCTTGYLINYKNITGKALTKNYGYMSIDKLVSLYGGSKSTWSKNLRILEVLGLIKVYNPRAGKNNTKEQWASINRMYQYNHKWAVRYYTIPAYTPSLLCYADQLSINIRQTAINKDSIRDVLGADKANIITDTVFNMTADTDNRRVIIKAVVMDLLQKGYTTKAEIFENCMCKANYSKYRWQQTYDGYRQLLFTELNLKESKPTRAEAAQYGLVTGKHIIRQVKPTKVLKPVIKPITTLFDIWWDLVEEFVYNGVWGQYRGNNINYKKPKKAEHTVKKGNSSLLKKVKDITASYTKG